MNKKKLQQTGKGKILAFALIGLFLFSGSMMVLFDFQPTKKASGFTLDFIKVKDGMFYYLDNKGYNFKFQCEINQILLEESEQIISDKQIIVISDNSFGRTVLTFDLISNGKVKFTIDHDGNMIRDYWFRITVYGLDFELLHDGSILSWDSGYFDFGDMMQEPSFWLDQNDGKYWLSVRFNSYKDFWIDPILSPTRTLTNPIVTESANTTDQFTTAYQPLFGNDELTDSSALGIINNPYWSPQRSSIIEEFDFIDDHKVFEVGYRFPFNSSQIIGGKAFVGLVDRGDGDIGNWLNIGKYFSESNYQGLSFNLTKEGVTGSDTSYNKIQLGQGQSFMSPYLNSTPFGSWYVRFKINKTSLDVANSYLRIQPTEELNYTWQFNSETNDLGLTRAEILDNEWHEFSIMITDVGNFIEPYDTIMAYQVFFDKKLVIKANTSLGIIGIPRYSIEVVVNGSSTSISQDANCQFLIDYMALILPLKNQLSTDSTIGDYSVESYSSILNPSNNSLVGLWSFETGEGSIAYDLTSNHDGVINGAEWNTTIFDSNSLYSLDFEADDVNDNVTIIDHDDFTFSTAGQDDSFSISLWVNIEDNSSAMYLISKDDEASVATDYEWSFYLGNSMQLIVILSDLTYANRLLVASSVAIDAIEGVWTHLSFTYNGNETKEGIALYQDGIEISSYFRSETGSYIGMGNGNANVSVGLEQDQSPDMPFDGLLDQVKIYNKELTASEISFMYQNDPILLEERSSIISYRFGSDQVDDYYIDNDNIVGYWRLEAGEGLTTYDLSGNNHDGVINGADWNTITFDNGSFYSLDFEESEHDDVTILDHDDFSFTDGNDLPFSISAWFNLESIGDIYYIVSKLDGFTDDGEWTLRIDPAGNVNFRVMELNWDDWIGVSTSASSISIGNWYHVVATYNGNETKEGLAIYLNGTDVSNTYEDSGSYTGMGNGDADVLIGDQMAYGDQMEMDGLIDQVKIINYNLTAAEVAYMYQNDPYTRIGFSNTFDYANDYSTRYNTDNSSNYLEGEELLRLNFGNYYRRVDSYISSKDDWYSYVSEGINLVNHPIMTFDMKAIFLSDVGNNSQFNSSLSNAYITLYNESMYPIGDIGWYSFVNYGEAVDDGYYQRDNGFTVINDSWISIRIDLQTIRRFDINELGVDPPFGNPVLSAIGGIGFSFYWNNLGDYDNKTVFVYSVKIDNLQFLSIQTVGSHGFDDYVHLQSEWFSGSASASLNIDPIWIKEGNSSMLITTTIGSQYASEIAWGTSDNHENEINVLDGSVDYLLFWIMPLDERMGFSQWNEDQQRDVRIRIGDPTFIFLPSHYLGYGDVVGHTGGPAVSRNDRLFMEVNQWYLFSLPINAFTWWYGTEDFSDGYIYDMSWYFVFENNGNPRYIIDGLSFVSGIWDYSNLTVDSYSGWTDNLQVNASQDLRTGMLNKGFADSYELTEQYGIHGDYPDYWYSHDIEGMPEDWTAETRAYNEYFPDAQFIDSKEGIEYTQGYAFDFAKAESDSFRDSNLLAWYRMNEGTGNDVNDSSLNDYNGTNFGADIVSNDPYGYALDFEQGDPDYVLIDDSNDFSFTDGNDLPFSVSVLVNIESVTFDGTIVAKDDMSNSYVEWGLWIDGGKLKFDLWNTGGYFDYIGKEMVSSIGLSQKIHIVATYDGSESSTGVNLYLDGVLVDVIDNELGSYTGMSNTEAPVYIGAYHRQFPNAFDGVIDEILIFDKELSVAEVVAIHPDRYDGIIAKWKMDTGSGTDVYDSYGDNDGENIGTADYVLNSIYGYALDFESSETDMVNISDSDSLSFGDGIGNDDPFSISLMFRLERDDAQFTFISKGDIQDQSQYRSEYRIYVTGLSGDKWIYVRLMNDTESNSNYISCGKTGGIDLDLDTERWYNLIFTYDGSESSIGMNIYLDGVNITDYRAESGTYLSMGNTDYELNIGANRDLVLYQYHFDGMMDEITIYDKELSAADVLSYYQEYEKLSKWYFGSNVIATMADINYVYFDVISGTPGGDHAGETTWLAIELDKTIDWTYWNLMTIRATSKDVTFSIRMNRGSASGNTAFSYMYYDGWQLGLISTSFCLFYQNPDNSDQTFFMDNDTLHFNWQTTFDQDWTRDFAIDSIKLYHVEGKVGGLFEVTSTNSWRGIVSSGGDKDYYYFNYSTNVKLFGNESVHVTSPSASADFGSANIYFHWGADRFQSMGYQSVRWGGADPYWVSDALDGYNWTGYDGLEFYMRTNESLSGIGDPNIEGQMHLKIARFGVKSDHSASEALTLTFNNATYDHIVNETGEYTGVFPANEWVRFYVPFDEYDYKEGTVAEILANVDYIHLELWNSEKSDCFSSDNGAFEVWIDGLRPTNFTYSFLGSSDRYDNGYENTISLINDFTGGSFNYNTSVKTVFMNYELNYLLNRNPIVSSFEGYITNGSNQVVYELNYTIASAGINEVDDYNHKFYIPKTYSFFNCTFGNGTVKTIESGFTITSYNDTHYVIVITVWEAGDWEWNFITENACFYLETTPSLSDGLVYNTTSISYNLQLKNGSDYLVGYPVLIEVKFSDETVLVSDTKTTTTGGWVNSSIDDNFPMQSDKRLYLTATSTNESFLGYITTYSLNYQDFDAPTIEQMVFDEKLVEKYPFILTVTIDDDYTETGDLYVRLNYGFISSGSLPEFTLLSYEAGVYVVQISGQVAETTIYFNVFVEDNMSNSYTSSTFSADWEEAPPAGGDNGVDDGDGDAPPPAVRSTTGSNLPIILVFLAGAGMVAILGYAVFRRVTVRTRRVETREVTTGIGGYGKTTERIEEKGG